MLPQLVITSFDAYLAARELRLEAVVIGGAALALMGVIERHTRDVDILHPELPEAIAQAARDFAREWRKSGEELMEDWLNNGPAQLQDVLPEGWSARAQPVFQGQALILSTLGRLDLLRTKLFALCDRGTDLLDCIALAPTAEELVQVEPWVALQDAHPQWPTHVTATLDDLRRRLQHGI